jgi:hypothetical protein
MAGLWQVKMKTIIERLGQNSNIVYKQLQYCVSGPTRDALWWAAAGGGDRHPQRMERRLEGPRPLAEDAARGPGWNEPVY